MSAAAPCNLSLFLFLNTDYRIQIRIYRKAFEEVENGLACEDGNMKECCTEEYVDIDSYNEDSLTLQSDEIHDNEEEEEEDEDESSKY